MRSLAWFSKLTRWWPSLLHPWAPFGNLDVLASCSPNVLQKEQTKTTSLPKIKQSPDGLCLCTLECTATQHTQCQIQDHLKTGLTSKLAVKGKGDGMLCASRELHQRILIRRHAELIHTSKQIFINKISFNIVDISFTSKSPSSVTWVRSWMTACKPAWNGKLGKTGLGNTPSLLPASTGTWRSWGTIPAYPHMSSLT